MTLRVLYAEALKFRASTLWPHPEVIAVSTAIETAVSSRFARVLPCETVVVVLFVRAVVACGTSARLKCVIHSLYPKSGEITFRAGSRIRSHQGQGLTVLAFSG